MSYKSNTVAFSVLCVSFDVVFVKSYMHTLQNILSFKFLDNTQNGGGLY